MIFSKEKLFMLNQLVQALPLEKRKAYLESLKEFWKYLQHSEDYLVDERDYNIYSVVKIGEQRWLGENLRYRGAKYQVNPDNLNLFYGLLYDWATVMDISREYNRKEWKGSDSCHQGIAPMGCHIPSDEDWKELERTLGMSEREVNSVWYRGNIGGKLKSSSGWAFNANGTNSSGFNALPAGTYCLGSLLDLGKDALFWSSTEVSDEYARCRNVVYENEEVGRNGEPKVVKCSLRCMLYK